MAEIYAWNDLRKNLILLFAAVLLVLGPGFPNPPAWSATFFGENPGAGLHEYPFRNARYQVYLPPDFDPAKRYPLVIISYMYSGNREVEPDDILDSWSRLSDERGYVVVMPMT